MPAPVAGVLRKVLRQTGETVAVGEVLGEIEAGAVAAAGAAAIAKPAPAPPRAAPRPPRQRARRRAARAAPAASPVPAPGERRCATSSHSRRAQAPRRARPREGRSAEALEAASGKAALAPAEFPAPGPRERLVPMSPLRRTVARRLLEAQDSAAILTTFNEVDMSRVMELRERYGQAFQEKHGVKLGFMGFFVKAAVEALAAFPSVNAEVRGDAVLFKDHYDVGVAVGGGKGLVVPVIRDADQLSLAADRALHRRAGQAGPGEPHHHGGPRPAAPSPSPTAGSTARCSRPPSSTRRRAASSASTRSRRSRWSGPDDTVVVRPMMYLALSYDHRIIDGREAVTFLVKVKELIEEPSRLMLDV